MDNLYLLALCFLLGCGLRASGRFPENAPATFNGFIVHVSLPALTLRYVHAMHLDVSLVWPAVMPWLVFALGAAFFWIIGRIFHLTRATCGGLMLYGSLGNTSFVGLPMIEAFYGNDHVATGLLIDQLGSYLVLSTIGILVAGLYSTTSTGFDLRGACRKCLRFPPFVALFAAILLIPFSYPPEVDALLERLGATLAPLALVSVGFQLRLRQLEGQWLPLGFGLGFKLLLAPTAIWLLYGGVLSHSGPEFQVTIFEAAMAPMIGASIVAMEHKLNAPLASLMIGIGIPLSFLTLPLWHAVL